MTGSTMAQEMREQLGELELTSVQQQILSAFYEARRDAIDRNRIPHATMLRLADTISYESDLAIKVMQQLDDLLIELVNDKIKRDADRMKSKGAK